MADQAQFDVDGALQSGATEDQILAHLNSANQFDVNGALSKGATKRQIIDHLATSPKPAPVDQNQTFADKHNIQNPVGRAALDALEGVGAGVVGTMRGARDLGYKAAGQEPPKTFLGHNADELQTAPSSNAGYLGKMAEQGAEYAIPELAGARAVKTAVGASKAAPIAKLLGKSIIDGLGMGTVAAAQTGDPVTGAETAAGGALGSAAVRGVIANSRGVVAAGKTLIPDKFKRAAKAYTEAAAGTDNEAAAAAAKEAKLKESVDTTIRRQALIKAAKAEAAAKDAADAAATAKQVEADRIAAAAQKRAAQNPWTKRIPNVVEPGPPEPPADLSPILPENGMLPSGRKVGPAPVPEPPSVKVRPEPAWKSFVPTEQPMAPPEPPALPNDLTSGRSVPSKEAILERMNTPTEPVVKSGPPEPLSDPTAPHITPSTPGVPATGPSMPSTWNQEIMDKGFQAAGVKDTTIAKRLLDAEISPDDVLTLPQDKWAEIVKTTKHPETGRAFRPANGVGPSRTPQAERLSVVEKMKKLAKTGADTAESDAPMGPPPIPE